MDMHLKFRINALCLQLLDTFNRKTKYMSGKKSFFQASGMIQWVRVHTSRSDGLSSVLAIYVVEGENYL